jgi:glycosyltransferase involved in cell wall biosynthesis
VGIGYESPKGRQASVPLNPELNYLISVARLIPSRNHEFLFSALHKLKDHCIGLILIGDGPDREKLETLASEMNIEVVFAGACYDPAFIEKMYNLSFASVMTGRVGLSIIQSLQMGVPVIAHSDADDQHPEFEVLENRYNSYLYENGNVADLGRVIRYAQQNPIINCASNCKMSVQFYNPDYQRGVIEKLAKDML